MSEISSRWDEIKLNIKNEYDLSQVSFDTWIVPLKFYEEKDNVVSILIPSNQSHALNYISDKYKDFFQVTISEMMNNYYDVKFILEKSINNNEETPNLENTYNINYSAANLNPKYKFDTFVVGGNNDLAHSASVAVAESPGSAFNPLFLYGGPGLGKTHLMHSIGHYILEHNPGMKVLYVTSETFTNEVIESIRSVNDATMNKLRDKYRTVDVLMVDDVQFIIGKERTQEEFFNTFNALHDIGKQIILSSDKPPKDMETLDVRFRSRFEMGLITDIQPPDFETRIAILRKKAQLENINVPNEVMTYIAKYIKSNIRELEGALTRVVAYSSLTNKNISLELATEALKDIISNPKSEEITVNRIKEKVSEAFNIKMDDFNSKKRTRTIAYPRQIAMYICRELTDLSLPKIGSEFGGRDHTTVIHAHDKISKDIEENQQIKDKIDKIISDLKG